MAGTPARALRTETALIGQIWSAETFATAQAAMAQDFTPLSDMRASAEYRARTAENMLMRYYHDIEHKPLDIRKVRA